MPERHWRAEGSAGLFRRQRQSASGRAADFYAQAAQAAKACGAKVIVDTSGPALDAALDEGVYLIKPNLRELREMTGLSLDDQDSRIDAARQLVEAGRVQIVALSLGHEGALFVTGEGAWRAPALEVELVSAVGAGDSFVGGLVWSLASGHDLEEAFRYALAAGSAALLTPGTELSRPTTCSACTQTRFWSVCNDDP
jgi:6-phosphofructokinase 2